MQYVNGILQIYPVAHTSIYLVLYKRKIILQQLVEVLNSSKQMGILIGLNQSFCSLL